MRFIPSILTKVQQLHWCGAALDALTYQRTHVRLCIISAIFGLLFGGLGTLAYFASHKTAWVSAPIGILAMLWLIWMGIKLLTLRLRNLGLQRWQIVAFIFVNSLTAGTGAVMAKTAARPSTALAIAAVLLAASAACRYIVYFREVPLMSGKPQPATELFDRSIRGETIGLLLLRTWVWYMILSVPLHIIFNY